MKPGHARALLVVVQLWWQRSAGASTICVSFVGPGTPPVFESTRDNSIETRALAGKFPEFPSNEEDGQRKVHAWFVGVAAWSRVR